MGGPPLFLLFSLILDLAWIQLSLGVELPHFSAASSDSSKTARAVSQFIAVAGAPTPNARKHPGCNFEFR